MKILFVICIAVLQFGCGVAVPPPAKVTLSLPIHRVEPPSSAISGYESINYTVTITNTSSQPIWFYGQLRELPFYSLFIRPNFFARWTDQTIMGCGLGADFHKIYPGKSTSFTVFVPGSETGHQMRVEVPIYDSPTNQSFNVTSESTLIE